MTWLPEDDCPPPSSKEDIGPCKTFDPTEANEILSIIAWCVTAAAVAGLIVIGINMALQVRNGEMGEGATHFRGVVIVATSCVLCATAGPLVEFVISPYL
ncbi:hypothetical protein [Streptomyces sp. NPDC048172]|uniref:hypothetical protein n=1 Tax=Streptomyces sp. NPDC048172 TaxID=3365505 RepID=UPI003721935E